MLGFVAENRITGLEKSIQWHEVAAAQEEGATVLDVRTEAEHARGAIPDAVNIPLDELRDRLDEVPEGKLIVHCGVGIRSHAAVFILGDREVLNLDGGYTTWKAGTSA